MKPVHVYIISDIHLGGEAPAGDKPGFQMCPPQARRQLARFVRHLILLSEQTEKEFVTELVINGDLVDFLAERDFQAFTRPATRALQKLQNIFDHSDIGEPEKEQAFRSLQAWVGAGYQLTILLGNHDIELCLPNVRQALLDFLTEGKPGRVQFLFDGEAYVRGALLVEHGNRYDGWNAVPYGRLRAYRSAISRGEPAKQFIAMPGSRLVTDIMNPLKSRYRFIDLLKPENEALIPILSALEPSSVQELRKIVPLLKQSIAAQAKAGQVPENETYIADGVQKKLGVKSEDEADVPASAEENSCGFRAEPYPDGLTGHYVDDRVILTSEQLLADAETLLRDLEPGKPGDRVTEAEAQVGDGLGAWLRSSLSLWKMRKTATKARYQHLRDALVAHHKSIGTTFELGAEDPIYSAAANRLAGGLPRVVVFGHTHLPRFVELAGGGTYINTGAWCPTISLPEKFYTPGTNDESTLRELQKFVDDMAENRLDEWTTLKTLFAHVVVMPDGSATAKLCEWTEDGRVQPLAG